MANGWKTDSYDVMVRQVFKFKTKRERNAFMKQAKADPQFAGYQVLNFGTTMKRTSK